MIYAIIIASSIAVAIYLKSRPVFKRIGRFLDKATLFAPDIIRVSLGLSLIFAAYFHSVFGPELPASSFFAHQLVEPFLYMSGVLVTIGLGTRIVGFFIAAFWLGALIDRGWYMLTYLNYFGEALALILIRRQTFSLDALLFKPVTLTARYEKWAMPLARILFGLSLFYAAINVKFVSAALSLDVVNRYELTRYFHFDPLFVVLGAGLVECLMALLFILGLLQRLNSLIFIAFITLSISFFKEAVWPHYLLLGLAVGIFLHKPDHLALDGILFGKNKK